MTSSVFINTPKFSISFTESLSGRGFLISSLNQKIGVNDEWNKATKEQLAQRDKLHELIIDFTNTFKNSKTGVRYALRAYDERILLKLEKTE